MILKGFEMSAASGAPISGATVTLYAASDTQPNPNAALQSTTTNINGMWQFTGLTEGDYDVKIEVPGETRVKWLKGNSRVGAKTITPSDVVARKNRIINGGMRVAQRPMPTVDNSYCLDRWRLLLGAANAATVAQVASSMTGTSKNSLKLTVGSGNNNKFGIYQPIEGADIYDLRGGLASLQFMAKATVGLGDIRAAILGWTSTEDSLTSDPINTWGAAGTLPVYFNAALSNLNTPTNLSVSTSGTLCTIEGVSIPSNVTNLAVFIWNDDTSNTQTTDTLEITDVQLEKGGYCTAIDRRSIEEETSLCQRFCQRVYGADTPFALSNGLGTSFWYLTMALPVSMRTAPTVPTPTSSTLTIQEVATVGNDFATWTQSVAGGITPATIELLYYKAVASRGVVVTYSDLATAEL